MNKQQLANRIWASANKLRSKIEANEYKDYILGFIFYKFLSEKEVQFLRENEVEDEVFSEELIEENASNLRWIQNSIGYFISYENLFSTWLSAGADFSVANVRDALSAFNRLVSTNEKKTNQKKVFGGIFDTLQSGLNKLGSTDPERTRAISGLLNLIKDIPMTGRQDYDVLGYIYEYLISQFAANAGKKAGEFYTPHEVSLLMSEIIAYHLRDKQKISIYDPTSGSGSLLINIGKSVSRQTNDSNSVKYYAQELKKNTYDLTRMNLVMRGIIPDNIVVRNGDTLADDWPYFEDGDKENTYQCLYVDAVVSNPPYSQSWTPPRKDRNGIQVKIDPRFKYGIAPRGKADYAFLLHSLYHLNYDGIMAIVLPHGVLFRGEPGGESIDDVGDQSEGTIRRLLVENNNIDTIIGLPENIFFGTGIPTIVMILRKNRKEDDVLIIDASKGCKKEGKKNKLRACDIKRIVETYKSRRNIPKYSRVVKKTEIRENGYNLNLPRYINSSEDLERWDIYATMFGGIPKSEWMSLSDYFKVFSGLEDMLVENTDTPCVRWKAENLREIVLSHQYVRAFIKQYEKALSSMNEYLCQKLLANMLSINVAQEEESITKLLFLSLKEVPLVDQFDAYQLFADKWETISQDLEIIQTEGFEATKKVDPNMVPRKRGDEDIEVQDGWVGRILPFDLVQANYLQKELQALQDLEARAVENSSTIESIYDELDEDAREKISNDGKLQASEVEPYLKELLKSVETEEIQMLSDYLQLNRKRDKLAYISAYMEIEWRAMTASKDGTYGAKEVQKRIADLRTNYPFADDSVEKKVIKLNALLQENKELNKKIKETSLALHERTKEVIEQELQDEQIMQLLKSKWIDSLYSHLYQLPHMLIDGCIEKLTALSQKYSVTMVDIDKNIREASSSLSSMIDDLTGCDADMEALAEFKKLLAL